MKYKAAHNLTPTATNIVLLCYFDNFIIVFQ